MNNTKKVGKIVVFAVILVAMMFVLPTGISSASPKEHNATEPEKGASPYVTTTVPPSSIPANTTLRVSPPPVIPKNVEPLTYVIAHEYVTIKGNSPPDILYLNITLPNTPWQAIILNYTDTSVGQVYDTRALMSVDNVTVFRNICPENGYVDVLANLTSYEPLFHGYTEMWFSPPADAVVGEYISNVTLSFYAGSAPSGLPNMIKPIINTSAHDFRSSSNSTIVNISVPSDTRAATLQVEMTGSGFDESWYANEPSYRALQIWANDKLIANVLPYYHVRSGELDLFAWRPLMSPYELNDPFYNVNVTGALGILEHSKNLTIDVVNPSPLGGVWIVRMNLLLWTSNDVKGATLVSYEKSSKTFLSTDVYMPNAGTSANGGNVSTPEYFVEKVNTDYSFASLIKTTTGTIYASKSTKEVSYMNQYAINLVWENWTAYQLTSSTMITRYNEAGNHNFYVDKKTSYYPFTADTGFSFSVTKTTNGGYPMYGPFAAYLNGTYIAWNVSNNYINITNHGIYWSNTFTSNSVSVQNGVFAGIIELTSPVSGIIVNITLITSNTTKKFVSVDTQFTGRQSTVSGYIHLISASSFNPPAPLYFGTVNLDQITTFHYTKPGNSGLGTSNNHYNISNQYWWH